jgi:hypothetical protein
MVLSDRHLRVSIDRSRRHASQVIDTGNHGPRDLLLRRTLGCSSAARLLRPCESWLLLGCGRSTWTLDANEASVVPALARIDGGVMTTRLTLGRKLFAGGFSILIRRRCRKFAETQMAAIDYISGRMGCVADLGAYA